MLDRGMAAEIAQLFDLGPGAEMSMTPVARGKEGLVWRLDTARGRWAVKEPLRQVPQDQVAAAALFRRPSGSPACRYRGWSDRSTGAVIADLAGDRVRVYAWVDLLPPDIAA